MKSIFLSFSILLLWGSISLAQTPQTDLFIVKREVEAGVRVFGAPKKISVHKGYNNQPSFSLNGKSIFFNADPLGNTDLFRYDLELDSVFVLTQTSVGEYSPTPIDEHRLVAVVVEPDSRQRLWEYDIRTGTSRLFIEERDSVGYFNILDNGDVPMFVLGTPQTLRIWNPKTMTERRVEGLPGRSIKKLPGFNGFTFIDTRHTDRHQVVAINNETMERQVIAQMPAGALDLLWTPDGTLLASSGSIIYQFSSEGGGVWKNMLDLKNFGLANISRMAISPDGNTLAIVSVYSEVPPMDEEP
jgi:Tol biopolymer transport system component